MSACTNRLLRTARTLFSLVVAAVVISSLALGQSRLRMTVSYTPVQTLSPADIDFEHFESRALLFTISITNTDNVSVNAKLQGTIDINLADRSFTGTAGSFSTNQFSVPPGGRSMTNMDIGRSGSIGTESFELNEEAKNRVQDVALATGQFPAGEYILRLDLLDLDGGNRHADSTQVRFLLQNLSRIDLRAPSNGEYTSDFPFFDFFYEGSGAIQASITVAEKLPDQSRADAISRKPPMLECELNLGQNSYLYGQPLPSCGSIRPLEQGKTYAWRVVGKMLTLGGAQVEISSPINVFTVSTAGQGSSFDAILNQLEEIFGQRYEEIFRQIRQGGFTLTGQYTLNGSVLTTADLLNILNQLRESAETAELNFQ